MICKFTYIRDAVSSYSDGVVLPDTLQRLMVINKEENIYLTQNDYCCWCQIYENKAGQIESQILSW